MSDPVAVVVPRENVNDESVLLVAWKVADGDAVTAGQVVAEVEGSKAAFEIETPVGGFVRIARDPGEEVPVGAALCHVSPQRQAQPAPRAAVAGDGVGQAVRFSHAARRLVDQRALSEGDFEGAGLVRELDILRRLGEAPAEPAAAQPPPPVAAGGVPYRTEPLSRNKRLEARYIAAGYHRVLRSAVTVAVPTRGLREAGPVIVFECARLLRKHARFNAFYADGKANLYDEVNIGFAVDDGRGLKVPVIRHADTKSLGQIADELRDHLVAYLEDDLSVESLAGGTFTVSDLSGEGVAFFDPLINQGQSAILGVSSESLTLAFDHHLADGRSAARFLGDLRARLEAHQQNDPPRCFRCSRAVHELAGRHYLVSAVRPDGRTGHLCTVCLGGW